MRILIFSDTHLTKTFRQSKFDFLKRIINEADQVIINGDFWDSYYISFDQFLESQWNGLFPALKNKDTIYIYGNHDHEEDIDERANLFSIEQKKTHKFKWKNKTIVIEHGDRLNKSKVQRYKWITSNKVVFKFLREMSHLVYGYISQKFLGGVLSKRSHRHLKEKVLKIQGKDEIFITGHSHINEIDLGNGFVNSGFIEFGIASYIWVTDEEIELVRRKY